MEVMETMKESQEQKQDTPPTKPPSLADLRVTRGDDGRYYARWGGEEHCVQVRSCFPWSATGAYLSLRDEADREVVLIPSLDEVDPGSRATLEQALMEAAFAFQITRVASVRKEFEIRQWVVDCVQGRRTFQTKVDDYPQHLPDGGLLITDVAGDVYILEDWKALDRHSRKQLALFVD